MRWLSLERERQAEESVLPVYDFDTTYASRIQERTGRAFDAARSRYTDALLIARMEGRNKDAVEAYQRLLSVNARDEEARTGVRTLRNQADGKALSGDDAGVVDRISGIFKKK